VRLARRLKGIKADDAIRDFLGRFDGASISLPRRFAPDLDDLTDVLYQVEC